MPENYIIPLDNYLAMIKNRNCMAWEPENLGSLHSLHWVAFLLPSPYLDFMIMGASLGSTLMPKHLIRRSTQLQQVSKSNFLVLR